MWRGLGVVQCKVTTVHRTPLIVDFGERRKDNPMTSLCSCATCATDSHGKHHALPKK